MHRAVGVVVAAAVVAVVVMLGTSAPRVVEAASVTVTSAADSGPGSLREAVTIANGTPGVNLIVLKNTSPISLTSYVEYTGPQPLTVRGDSLLTNRVVQGPSSCALFFSSGGADITFQRVTFQDSLCAAIDVSVDNGDGEVIVTLDRVVIQRMGTYGLIASESGPRDASIRVKLAGSVIQDTGSEGLYVYEDGPGALTVDMAWSSFTRTGGFGAFAVSYEGGDLNLTASNSSFNDNEGNGLTLWTKSGANAQVTLQNVQANGNGDRGVYLEDLDEGGVVFRGSGSTFSDNGDFGLGINEAGEGSVQLTVLLSRLDRNGAPGLVVVENGSGSVDFLVSGSTVWGNDCCSPADVAVQLIEMSEGDLRGIVSGTTVYNNGGDGFLLAGEGEGQFDVTMYLTVALGNSGAGTRASAIGDPGVLRLLASAVGPYDLTNVTVVP